MTITAVQRAVAHRAPLPIAGTGQVEKRSLPEAADGSGAASVQTQLEQRDAALRSARAIEERAAAESRDPTDAETAEFKAHEATVRRLNASIERRRFLDEQERGAPVVVASVGDGNFETQCRSFSICRAIADHLQPGSVPAGREREISTELARRSRKEPQGILVPHEALQEKRALLTSNSGQNLYPERHRDDLFIDRLRESLRVGQLGATVLSGLTGTQDIPKMTGSVTPYWVGEDEDVTESEATFDSVQLTPKTVGAETAYSRRMVVNASPDVEQLLRRDLSSVLATAIDSAAITGTGLANKPRGILNTAGTTTTPVGSATPFADLAAFEALLATDNALMGRLGWLVNPKTHAYIRALQRSEDVAIMQAPGVLLDYPILQTNHVPSDAGADSDESPIIFGNWSDLLIGYWSVVDILVNPYHADVYSKGGIKINALQDVDIAVRHPESFVIGEGLSL